MTKYHITQNVETTANLWIVPDLNRFHLCKEMTSKTGKSKIKNASDKTLSGGEYRIRTDDPLRARQVL